MNIRAIVPACLLLAASCIGAWAGDFDDAAIARITYPSWFKHSFLDLHQDLADAVGAGKLGLLLFVGTQGCSYCHLFLKESLGDPAIAERVQAQFDTIGLEIFDDAELIDFNGETQPVKRFVLGQGVQFAPTLLFYAPDGTGGARLLARVSGYYEPERFSRVLDYLTDGQWRRQPLEDYLAAAAQVPSAASGGPGRLIPDPLFAPPPYALARKDMPAARPLVVIFESAACSRCPRFHREVIQDPDIRSQLEAMEVVQLDVADERTPLLTPSGERTTPAAWYRELGFTDLPALLFVSEQGENVLRSDALVLEGRMNNALGFVRERAYDKGWTYQRYARTKALERAGGSTPHE
jgi:thioredoxin-related protein